MTQVSSDTRTSGPASGPRRNAIDRHNGDLISIIRAAFTLVTSPPQGVHRQWRVACPSRVFFSVVVAPNVDFTIVVGSLLCDSWGRHFISSQGYHCARPKIVSACYSRTLVDFSSLQRDISPRINLSIVRGVAILIRAFDRSYNCDEISIRAQ